MKRTTADPCCSLCYFGCRGNMFNTCSDNSIGVELSRCSFNEGSRLCTVPNSFLKSNDARFVIVINGGCVYGFSISNISSSVNCYGGVCLASVGKGKGRRLVYVASGAAGFCRCDGLSGSFIGVCSASGFRRGSGVRVNSFGKSNGASVLERRCMHSSCEC